MGVLNKDIWHLEVRNIRLRDAVQPRRWGMLVTVTGDPTPSNNTTWVLVQGLASQNRNDNDNWQKIDKWLASLGALKSELGRQYFEGDGATTDFEIAQPGAIFLVEVGGQVIDPDSDYSLISESKIRLTFAPDAGQRIGVYFLASSGSPLTNAAYVDDTLENKMATGRYVGVIQDEEDVFEIIDKNGNVAFHIENNGQVDFVRKPLPVLTRNRTFNVVTVTDSEPGISRAFVGMANVNDRIYILYRHSAGGHNGYGGVIKSKYSDDFGDTWSEEVTVYDASEMQGDHPEIWIAEPSTETDVRDPRAIITEDGYFLMAVFVAFGYLDGNSRTKTADPITLTLKVPINPDNSLDWENATKIELPERISFGGGITKHKGTIYLGLYGATAKLYESIDNAETWVLKSTISDSGNETALTFCGEILYAVVRPNVDQPEVGGILRISYDYGATWQEGNTPYQLHGMSATTTTKNRMLLFGRDQSGPDVGTIAYLMSHDKRDSYPLIIQERRPGIGADFGYGTVIRVENYYLFGWYRADVNQADSAIYFTKLPLEEIENMSLSPSNFHLLQEVSALDVDSSTDTDVKNKVNEIIDRLNKFAL